MVQFSRYRGMLVGWHLQSYSFGASWEGRIILKVSKMRGLFILFTKVLFLYANYWFNHLAAARLETPARILCPHHLTISEQ